MRTARALTAFLGITVLLAGGVPALAQDGAEGSPRARALLDFTGAWISIVTEDWQYRMVTPRAGFYGGVPISAEGRRVAEAWDPAQVEAAGEECRAYGAAAIMRVPGRLRISWQDDDTLRIDTEAGGQTRLLRFGAGGSGGEPGWQGHTRAEWQQQGNLKAMTTAMRAGYLRKNGVPYGEDARLTEYFDKVDAGDEEWLVVTAVVEDPLHLTQPYVTTSHFRKLPDASDWSPQPCSAR